MDDKVRCSCISGDSSVVSDTLTIKFITFSSCHSQWLLGDTVLAYLTAIMPDISLIFTRLTPKFETQIDILRFCFQ